MAHKASPITILNDDRIGTFNVVTISYTYNDTTLASGPLSVSPEEAAGLSASFRSSSWSPTSAYGQGLGFTPYFQSSGSPGRFPADGETLAVPEGCREAFRKFAPWNNPQNVISARTTELLESVVYCGVLPLLCVLGLFTNFLSCAVFYRLGVKRGINLCLFLLSLSDQLFLLSKTSAKTSKVVLKLSQGEEGAGRWDYAVVSYHLIRKPVIFVSFSNFLTMLASLDRCTSIVSPLKARLIFTHKIIVTAIVTAFVVTVGWNVFIGFRFKPQCIYNSQEKSTVWDIGASEMYRNNKEVFNTVDTSLVFVFPFLSVLVVIVCTIIIILKIKEASRWRQKSVRGDTGSGSSKLGETQLNKMLIVVSIIHVVSTLPSITKDIVKLVNPDFNLFGHYGNLFVASIATKDAAAAINCSVNFFVYRTLSSQFRHTLSAMLETRSANANTSTSVTDTVSTMCASNL